MMDYLADAPTLQEKLNSAYQATGADKDISGMVEFQRQVSWY